MLTLMKPKVNYVSVGINKLCAAQQLHISFHLRIALSAVLQLRIGYSISILTFYCSIAGDLVDVERKN